MTTSVNNHFKLFFGHCIFNHIFRVSPHKWPSVHFQTLFILHSFEYKYESSPCDFLPQRDSFLRMKTLLVSEIFSSIQGESHHAGYPCTFIRLAGCNLDCVYCDTGYARSGGEPMSIQDIVGRVVVEGMPVVELTGGEPLSQTGALELLKALVETGKRVLLETNGSLPVEGVPAKVTVVMDIKTPASGMAGFNRWENIAALKPEDEIKVVICGREDYEWAVSSLGNRNVFGRLRVSLSPAAGLVEPSDLAAWMMGDRLDARFQLQLHRILWPNLDRGV